MLLLAEYIVLNIGFNCNIIVVVKYLIAVIT